MRINISEKWVFMIAKPNGGIYTEEKELTLAEAQKYFKNLINKFKVTRSTYYLCRCYLKKDECAVLHEISNDDGV